MFEQGSFSWHFDKSFPDPKIMQLGVFSVSRVNELLSNSNSLGSKSCGFYDIEWQYLKSRDANFQMSLLSDTEAILRVKETVHRLNVCNFMQMIIGV